MAPSLLITVTGSPVFVDKGYRTHGKLHQEAAAQDFLRALAFIIRQKGDIVTQNMTGGSCTVMTKTVSRFMVMDKFQELCSKRVLVPESTMKEHLKLEIPWLRGDGNYMQEQYG